MTFYFSFNSFPFTFNWNVQIYIISVTVLIIGFNKRHLHSQEFNKNSFNNLINWHSTWYKWMCHHNAALNTSCSHQTTDIAFQLQIAVTRTPTHCTPTCAFLIEWSANSWLVSHKLIYVSQVATCCHFVPNT